jgi:hypothetical protein
MSKKINMIHQPQKNQIATKSSFESDTIFLVGYRFQRSPNFRKKPILSHFSKNPVFIALFSSLYHTKAIKWS